MPARPQKIHFIAIGGSVMHTLAIAVKQAGNTVTGSDDEITDPSKSKLLKHNLLPEKEGWFPERLDRSYDAVILGMHAKGDNPELKKAQELGLPVYSFPDYIFEQSKDKQRIVIAGSHGKTTITAMILHVLNFHHREFDYVIGAQVPGLENNVRLSNASVIIIEGDEYLTSPLDPVPKFLKYQHHVGVVSGVAWDHANVFPTEQSYIDQFSRFADATPKAGILIYCETDPIAARICSKERPDITSIPYKIHGHATENGRQILVSSTDEKFPLEVFGDHNLLNLSAAKEVLKKIGITSSKFYAAIQSFKGAAGRLERLQENPSSTLFRDFAHAPSKVKATTEAVKRLYPKRKLVSCLELHTFSSLDKKFLPQYRNTMKACDVGVVYFDPEKVRNKNLPALTEEDVRLAFGDTSLKVFTEKEKLADFLKNLSWENSNLLMMSSGNFGGLNLTGLIAKN
jgi:UDP-N-acetylmuramate: L-alanyl-gamma-D-glutamyl-meso-diaminopimelate ligase